MRRYLTTGALVLLSALILLSGASAAMTPVSISYDDPYPPPSSPVQEITLQPPETWKQDPTLISEALLRDAQTYAAQYSVSVEEAIQRLSLQKDIGAANSNLSSEERGTFAGIWIQHTPEFRIFVRFKNGPGVQARAYLQNSPFGSLIVFQTAEASLQELRAEQALVSDLLKSSEIPFMTGIDTSEGIVNLYVTDPSAVTGYLKSIGRLLPEHVRIVQLKSLATPVEAIYGGLSLDSPAIPGPDDCTSGFSVIGRFNNVTVAGVTTAGHCKDQMYYDIIMLNYKYGTPDNGSGPYDIQWHGADHAFTVVGKIEDGWGGGISIMNCCETIRFSEVSFVNMA